ncbi:MAG: Bax inhibitor-1 family protein, partial [Planctomycetes bacterium]|nr:Bax inhibitor-1 family protein [Planctomycetota bacterium]
AFLLTGGIFAVMALWGYFTRSDLSSVGSLASMLLLGLVLASIVNLFVASDALGWLVTYGIVAAVCALTAYDVQRLKKIAQGVGPSGEAVLERAAITGAFVLYIDFIILFWQILRILSASSRRN